MAFPPMSPAIACQKAILVTLALVGGAIVAVGAAAAAGGMVLVGAAAGGWVGAAASALVGSAAGGWVGAAASAFVGSAAACVGAGVAAGAQAVSSMLASTSTLITVNNVFLMLSSWKDRRLAAGRSLLPVWRSFANVY